MRKELYTMRPFAFEIWAGRDETAKRIRDLRRAGYKVLYLHGQGRVHLTFHEMALYDAAVPPA